MAKSVLVLIYGESNSLSESMKEVLAIGRKLADDLGRKLTAVSIGDSAGDIGQQAVSFGADTVILVENDDFKTYDPDLYLAALEQICGYIDPMIILLCHDAVGADLAPRLAFRLRTGLTTDCIDLNLDQESKRLLRTKPVYGGNFVGVYCSQSDPQIATIREKVFTALERDESREGEIVKWNSALDTTKRRIEHRETIEEQFPGPRLEEAEVIVGVGRGLGGPEPITEIRELATLLGGTIAGTRPTCEKGWLHPKLQVGLTGTKVTPRLYIAIAVSGAVQHLAGLVGTKTIVAINKDPEALIFNESHYGVVGDYKEVLPAFKQKVKELLQAK